MPTNYWQSLHLICSYQLILEYNATKSRKTTAETQGLQTPVFVINLISRHTTCDENDLDVTRLCNNISKVRLGMLHTYAPRNHTTPHE